MIQLSTVISPSVLSCLIKAQLSPLLAASIVVSLSPIQSAILRDKGTFSRNSLVLIRAQDRYNIDSSNDERAPCNRIVRQSNCSNQFSRIQGARMQVDLTKLEDLAPRRRWQARHTEKKEGIYCLTGSWYTWCVDGDKINNGTWKTST